VGPTRKCGRPFHSQALSHYFTTDGYLCRRRSTGIGAAPGRGERAAGVSSVTGDRTAAPTVRKVNIEPLRAGRDAHRIVGDHKVATNGRKHGVPALDNARSAQRTRCSTPHSLIAASGLLAAGQIVAAVGLGAKDGAVALVGRKMAASRDLICGACDISGTPSPSRL
jgi:hypothetical protein